MRPICAALVIPHRLSSPIRIEELDHDLVSRQVLVAGNVKQPVIWIGSFIRTMRRRLFRYL